MTELIAQTEDWPPVDGRPGIVQGCYGAAGNLELVAPAVDDGLWVGWLNADPVDTRAGALRLRWSGALRFDRGRTYVRANISQVDASNRALEVLAIDDAGVVVRHVWTADHGFREHGVLRSETVAVSRILVLPDGWHTCVLLDVRGQVWSVSGSVDRHPAWAALADPLGVTADDVDAALHDGHVDLVTVDQGEVWLRCPLEGLVRVGEGRAAQLAVDREGSRWVLRSDLAGSGHVGAVGRSGVIELELGEATSMAATYVDGTSRLDLVTRSGTSLQHLVVGVSGGQLEMVAAQPVVADVWLDSSAVPLTVHRGL